MKPIDQRNESDCLRCCIASVFELPYEAVPHFGPDYDVKEVVTPDRASADQDAALVKWLAERGLSHLNITNPDIAFENGAKQARCPWGFCVAGGFSPRGDWSHAVVYDARDGKPIMVHDPHKSRFGLRGRPEYFTCFLVEDPAKLRGGAL